MTQEQELDYLIKSGTLNEVLKRMENEENSDFDPANAY